MCGFIAYSGTELRIADLDEWFRQIGPRGPDDATISQINSSSILGFHRLAIMDPSAAGNQPFRADGRALVCNGEIYNYKQLAQAHRVDLKTGSDCEVLLPLHRELGIDALCKRLDGVFAFAVVDQGRLYFARDPIGIRPLFIAKRMNGAGRLEVMVSSEVKGIPPVFDDVEPFPPGNFGYFEYDTGRLQLTPYYHYDYPELSEITEEEAIVGIREKLFAAVDKRMMSDRPIGCLVSGGVDSSLIAAMVAKHYDVGTLHTFNVGLRAGASDRAYARIVADAIGSVHHEVNITRQEALDLLKETVYTCESFDTTTIRASTMQLAMARYISSSTPIKVIFNGDVIDEASGSYVYFKNAPSDQAYQEESVRLMKEIHLYDVLRADRTISGCGLEARVPFADLDFVKFYMAIPAKLRKPREGVEKYLLRKAFDGFLPDEVLWRPKEAFSDGCSSAEDSWFDIIHKFVEPKYTEEQLRQAQNTFAHCPPRTKEQLYYREWFETHFADRSNIIPHFWMPKWVGEDVIDPSARVLTDVYRPTEKVTLETSSESLKAKNPAAPLEKKHQSA